MALHTETTIHKTAYDLFDAIMDLVKNMPRILIRRGSKRLISQPSHIGLLRQATHSHHDRARLANVLRYRGHCIKSDLTKTYRRKT